MSQQRGTSNAANPARLGHAVATILSGAAAGGLHGAAIAGVKVFLPEILKAALYIILLVVLIPCFLYFSVVNPNYQFPSIADKTVRQMNAQAVAVGGLYDQFDRFTYEEADAIVARLSAGYDDIVVTEDFGNTNRYWLIAISSVLHEQDLSRITEQTVRGLVRQNLDYDTRVEVYYDSDDDEHDHPYYRIYIRIYDVGQDALMRKLGFDAFKQNWAKFLYQNQTGEKQVIDPTKPDYDGDRPGVELGDITFADGVTDVVYYSQMDERWCNEAYGKTQTIGVAGCGPTALAIVVSSLTDTQMNPKAMADWAYKNGYCCEGDGSYRTLIPEGARHFGLSVETPGRDGVQAAVDALAQGKLVVAIMGAGTFTTGGHFIVLRGVTKEGKILVADPVSYRKSQME